MQTCARCGDELTPIDDLDQDEEVCNACIMEEWNDENKQLRREFERSSL